MSIKNLISRKNDVTHEEHKIICDNPELKELITDWCKHQGHGDYEQFAMFLELVGISTPVKLSGFCKTLKPAQFLCVNAHGKEYSIALGFGDFTDECFEIYVTEEIGDDTVTKEYEIFEKPEDEVSTPYAALVRKTTTKGKMKLSSRYSWSFWRTTVTVDDSHQLEIYVSRPNSEEISFEEIWVCKNNEALEQYLFEYNYRIFAVDDIYAKLEELFELKLTDLSIEYKKVYNSDSKKSSRTLATIYVKAGRVETYAYFDSYDEESYLVKSNGDWICSNDVYRIAYSKEQNKMDVSCEGTEDEISCIDLQTYIMSAKERIKKVWYKVNT